MDAQEIEKNRWWCNKDAKFIRNRTNGAELDKSNNIR